MSTSWRLKSEGSGGEASDLSERRRSGDRRCGGSVCDVSAVRDRHADLFQDRERQHERNDLKGGDRGERQQVRKATEQLVAAEEVREALDRMTEAAADEIACTI